MSRVSLTLVLYCITNNLYSYISHGNTLLMENKHGKLLVIYAVQRCKFRSKMYQYMFGGRVPPGPAGGANALPRPFSRNEGPTSKAGMRGERRRGEQIREKGRGNRGEGRGTEGKRGPPVTKTQLRPCLHAILWFITHLHFTWNCTIVFWSSRTHSSFHQHSVRRENCRYAINSSRFVVSSRKETILQYDCFLSSRRFLGAILAMARVGLVCHNSSVLSKSLNRSS